MPLPLWPPTPNQRLLLAAALLPSVPALAAWRAWRTQVDIEHTHLDSGSYHLLPLAWRNLHALAEDDPLMGRLRGIRRRTWYVNQRLLAAASQATQTLAGAGIEALLLDGAAVMAGYDQAPGVHMLDAVTLLVRPQQAAHSLRTLTDAGWQPRGVAWRASDFDLASASFLVDAADQRLRVQWHLVSHDRRRGADDSVWANARARMIIGRPTLLPAPVDLALALVGNLPAHAPAAVLPRLADLWTVLNHAHDAPNEDLLHDMACARRVEGLLAMVRGYLEGLDSGDAPPMSAEDALCAALARPATRVNRLRLRWLLLRLSEASAGRGGPLRAVLRFPRYWRLTVSTVL
jgi:hypothetical protein